MDKLPVLSRDDRLLILAPHPDDEVLATGGLLQRAAQAKAATRVIFLTDGDNNPWPQRALERRWRVSGESARARWGVLRRQEALASLRILGHGADSAEFWALPDQGLTNLLLTAGTMLTGKLCEAINAWRPSLLVAPALCDRHPDHSALGVVVNIVLRKLALVGQPPPCLLSYVVHGDLLPGHARGLELVLTPDEVETKRSAILRHRSQTLLSRGRFLAHARLREPFLIDRGVGYTTGSHPVRRVRQDADGLSIDFNLRFLNWIAGQPKMHILAESTAGELRHVCLPLYFLKTLRSLRVPSTEWNHARQTVFVKLETGFGFHDAVGWICLSGLESET